MNVKTFTSLETQNLRGFQRSRRQFTADVRRNPQRSEQSNDLAIMSAPCNKSLNWKVKKCTVGFISTPALCISRRLMLKFGIMSNIPLTGGFWSTGTEKVMFYWFRQMLSVSSAYSAGFVPWVLTQWAFPIKKPKEAWVFRVFTWDLLSAVWTKWVIWNV